MTVNNQNILDFKTQIQCNTYNRFSLIFNSLEHIHVFKVHLCLLIFSFKKKKKTSI